MPDSPDRLFGLMAGAGPGLAVGLLGILKAGGGFVPLHPAQPEECLRSVVRDRGLAVMVTESRYLELALRVGGEAGCVRHVVCLDEPAEVPPLPAGVELRALAGAVPDNRRAADLAVYVLSRRGELQPPGLPGELWIGGPGLDLADLGRPDLTAAALVPDHLGGEPGGRLYRTGNRARRLPEGGMELLGRVLAGHRPEPAAGGAPESPRTPVKELVAEIWCEVLGRERVGLHESFFDLGGHSLLATRVIARLRSLLGVDLPVRALFQAPTVSALAREVEALLGTGLAPAPPIVPVPRGGELVLSYGQERLWFLDQLEPGNAAYNMTSAVRLLGELDGAALERALGGIVRRHESLRTVFSAVDGGPVQRIEPPGAVGLPRIDLTALPPAEREAEIRRLLRQAARRPFDLARGPLARFTLLALGALEHALIAELHHIVADGWSTGVLLRELAVLYQDPSGARLPRLPVQYADYAAWQRSWLSGEALEARLAFWRGELEGAPAALELPADRPRPPVSTHRGFQLALRLPVELTAALRGVARSGGATLFMALLAGFQTLLSRLSGQPELLVGTPVAGRERIETEGLIGFFVNTLVIRGDLRGQPSFRELLGRVRERSLAAFGHQEVPFEKLVEDLELERDLSRSPLVQVLFALQNVPLRLELPELEMSLLEVDHGTAKFDLSLLLMEQGEELSGWLEVSADLFEEATAARLAGDFRSLLEAAAAAPDERLLDLPQGSAEERRQILGRVLPAPPAAEERGEAARRGQVEEVLAGVFAEVLGSEPPGRHASFFDLGGHSLLAARLTARVRQALGVKLPLATIFQAPTVASLARRVEEELAGCSADRPGPIPRVPREGPLPASFAQERLWFLDQLEPGRPTYHIPAAVRLRGPLDAAALAGALGGVVRRHEALRTVFAATADGPVQVILPAAPISSLPLPEIDLTALPWEAREGEARRAAGSEARRPFDLAAGPLLRAALVRMEVEDHLLLFNLHHIAGDGASMTVLLREAGALYRANLEGRPAALPPLPVQYADFAVWQRERLRGSRLELLLSLWRDRLAGAPPAIELPADRPRPAEPTGRGGTVPLALSAEVSHGLAGLARRQGATRFMVLLAGLDALLARLSGQTDLVVGVPVAGRTRVETEGLIGLFVNTLPLRVGCGGDPPAGELLARVRGSVLTAHAHQELPFERLVEELRPERDLSRSPLFQVMLAPGGSDLAFDLPGIAAETLPVDTGTARFDLTFLLGEETPVAGFLEYSSDLFDAATAARLAGWWQTLLAGLAREGETAHLSDLPLLSGDERVQLLAAGDGGLLPAEEDACLHELFARRAAARPNAEAVLHGELRVTYGELAARAARLAEWLREAGVGPEVPVGVCAPRTPDLIAALLGVLAAGGCYLPLDPAYPPERLALMLEDAGAPVVLAAESVRDRLPAGPARLALLEEVAGAGSALPGGAALPGNLAYLIYTSGSTGRPKGVAIEHRSAVALVRWARGVFAADELAGVLASTSVCFDLSVFEIFVPLALGGRVILAENALELPALPAASEVTLINTVPSAVSALLRAGGLPRSVRTVNLAGEPLPRSLVRAIHAGGCVERVLDLYGPSEDTTYSTGAVIDPAAEGAPEIGRPIAGTRGFVLDADGRLLPAGVPGELYLGGAGLARGYLGRPALTAERFVPDPFTGEPGARLYRTGDRVRWQPGGALDFLGRIDHQVKVRGFRIELGEIEDALSRHPLVRQAAVVAHGAGEDRRLVAYVAAGEDAAEDARHVSEALSTHLSGRLPAYMVPAAFVVVDALPLSPNGKVDRRSLPAPGEPRRASGVFVPPRTPTEEAVAAIWAEALGIARVGLGQSFFDLGGHSLKAAAVAARIRDRFGLSLPLRELFVAGTVEAVAARIEEELLASASDERFEELLALLDAEEAEEEIAGKP